MQLQKGRKQNVQKRSPNFKRSDNQVDCTSFSCAVYDISERERLHLLAWEIMIYPSFFSCSSFTLVSSSCACICIYCVCVWVCSLWTVVPQHRIVLSTFVSINNFEQLLPKSSPLQIISKERSLWGVCKDEEKCEKNVSTRICVFSSFFLCSVPIRSLVSTFEF